MRWGIQRYPEIAMIVVATGLVYGKAMPLSLVQARFRALRSRERKTERKEGTICRALLASGRRSTTHKQPRFAANPLSPVIRRPNAASPLRQLWSNAALSIQPDDARLGIGLHQLNSKNSPVTQLMCFQTTKTGRLCLGAQHPRFLASHRTKLASFPFPPPRPQIQALQQALSINEVKTSYNLINQSGAQSNQTADPGQGPPWPSNGKTPRSPVQETVSAPGGRNEEDPEKSDPTPSTLQIARNWKRTTPYAVREHVSGFGMPNESGLYAADEWSFGSPTRRYSRLVNSKASRSMGARKEHLGRVAQLSVFCQPEEALQYATSGENENMTRPLVVKEQFQARSTQAMGNGQWE
ncbi:uncharacterized protein EI90DRAFT_3016672 [Cantharellus anzutake]|uniref:uncharacterized protein n=1 Tax=Cantharellus anzutake TaxID=1750568 RepID=UPI001902C57F|nr:uncharacterized protein EI90DRAFT_3016672 [Cantharellus anzutake]KAF8330851.1 hypothetical protein EI90DRAFT_3016672 [Cantharellus anzutake]